MIKEAIQKVVAKGDLTFDEAYSVMKEIMSGQSTPTQNAAYLAALSTKSARAETTEEIAGSAAAMREMADRFSGPFDTLEIVGTGGDKSNSFNISTTSMFVIAASGVKVAKHGNRAASSKSGTADCLEALGVNINQDPETCTRLLQDINMCFMSAQKYHKSMSMVAPIRAELGFRTVFSILGPLTNPIGPKFMVLGVYDSALVEPLAQVISDLGVRHGMVVFGEDKLDEISVSAPTQVCEVKDGEYRNYEIYPEVFGLPRAEKGELEGGSAEENAQITRDILAGKLEGAKLNTVLLNSAAGLYVGGKARSLAAGVDLAREIIASGAAYEKIDEFVAAS